MKKILREVFNIIWILKNKIFRNYNVTIHATTIFNRDTIFEGYNKIGRYTNVNSSIIGLGSYIGSNCSLHNAKIGRFCSIASNVDIIIGDHPINYVSTHPAFFSNKKQAGFTFATVSNYDELKYVDCFKKYYIEMGNDVWIGQNVKIFQGVKIGSGAIIGSGSMVIRDIEPYSINVGIPSKKIKKRFSDDVVNFLLDFEWWNKDFGWIMKNAILFENVEKFKKQFCSEID